MIGRKLSLCTLGLAATLLVRAEARLPTEGIVGGDITDDNQFPYQVSLQHYNWSRSPSFCGGGIVGDRFILTAAHCVVMDDGKFKDKRIFVVAGTSDLSEASRTVRIEVAKVYVPADNEELTADEAEDAQR